jgi:hypothetical protein
MAERDHLEDIDIVGGDNINIGIHEYGSAVMGLM